MVGSTELNGNTNVNGDTELNGAATVIGQFITPASKTAVEVSGKTFNIPKTNSRVIRLNAAVASTIVTSMDAGADGQEIILINVGAFRIQIQGAAGTITPASLVLAFSGINLDPFSSLHLIYDGSIGAWIEITRSINEFNKG